MTDSMHAAVLEAPFKISIREIPKPKPRADQVLLRVASVGLCGTDIHIFRGEGNYNMDQTGRVIPLEEQPQILGHEFCGQVVEVGALVKELNEGDRVVVDQGLNCHSVGRYPRCEYCHSGDSHQCSFYQEHGITGIQGAMADYIAVPAVNTVKIPESLSFLEAAVSEPLGCVLHASQVMERTRGRYGFESERHIRSILICGSGPAGLLFIQYLRNVRKFDGLIIAVDKQEKKLSLAEHYGAEPVKVERTNLIEAVTELTRGQKVEYLIDACGSAQLFEQIPWLIRKQGTVLLYGHGHRGKDIGILNLVQFLEPTLIAPVGASGGFGVDGRPTTYSTAVKYIQTGQVDARSMITHAYPSLECLQRALSDDYRQPSYVKGVVQLMEDS